jgi:hypothetical protein
MGLLCFKPMVCCRNLSNAGTAHAYGGMLFVVGGGCLAL